MMGSFSPYSRQCIDDDDISAVAQALRGDIITGGCLVSQFEADFAARIGAKYAVAVANGTAALHIAYMAAGLVKGDSIITTPLTFAATANAAIYCGAKPLFADINSTGNIEPSDICRVAKENSNNNIAIIAPVHFGGQPSDLERISEIASECKAMVIEDACHALGALYKGSLIGACKYSAMTVFSFHPVKHITTGEGGMVTTNDPHLYERLKLLRSHGIKAGESWQRDMVLLGYNYRLPDINCALGISQLKKLDWFLERRRHIAALYDELLKGNECLQPLVVSSDVFHSYHLYPVLLRAGTDRDNVLKTAFRAGIGLQVHYSLVYNHSYYRENYPQNPLPIAEDYAERIVSLPIYPQLTDEGVKGIVSTLSA
ncbi:UDP-4-amino-4,6-dideoxy-N-acetyl-beta-L-altrosamine transaminase [Deferribacterales bacterium]|nr:UDP-4-amino-4,6-dideoxy-N-acetyl-beta-L-altrosamine transaminase [Deferribacterales bacterium]